MALPTACPLCQAGPDRQAVVTRHVYGAAGDRAFFRCAHCDAIHLHPQLSAEEEAKFYSAEFERFMAGRAGAAGGWAQADAHIAANEPTRLRREKYLAPLLAGRRRVLEVGCSSGFMLHPLARGGVDCTGVEPSGAFRDSVAARGITCFESLDALEAAAPAPFDLIMHFFVLEHVREPAAFLRRQLALLRRGGALVFEVPNAADALWTVLDVPEFERFYWSVAHHWYFTERSLAFLLDGLGRKHETLLDQRYDLSNHLVWARDGKPGGMGRFTPVWGEAIEQAYREALVKARRCDTLVGVVHG